MHLERAKEGAGVNYEASTFILCWQGQACMCMRGDGGEADALACVNLAACLMLTHADHLRLMHKSSSSIFINVSTSAHLKKKIKTTIICYLFQLQSCFGGVRVMETLAKNKEEEKTEKTVKT